MAILSMISLQQRNSSFLKKLWSLASAEFPDPSATSAKDKQHIIKKTVKLKFKITNITALEIGSL